MGSVQLGCGILQDTQDLTTASLQPFNGQLRVLLEHKPDVESSIYIIVIFYDELCTCVCTCEWDVAMQSDEVESKTENGATCMLSAIGWRLLAKKKKKKKKKKNH